MPAYRNQMSGNDEKDCILFSRALKHFSERLCMLQKEDETIRHGNEILKQDMDENSKQALEIAQTLDEGKTENISKNSLKMIKSALHLYKKDLQESTKSLIIKLGTTMPHKNVDDTIRLIDSNLDHRKW